MGITGLRARSCSLESRTSASTRSSFSILPPPAPPELLAHRFSAAAHIPLPRGQGSSPTNSQQPLRGRSLSFGLKFLSRPQPLQESLFRPWVVALAGSDASPYQIQDIDKHHGKTAF